MQTTEHSEIILFIKSQNFMKIENCLTDFISKPKTLAMYAGIFVSLKIKIMSDHGAVNN